MCLDSLQELTRIFESGRKYRNRIVKNIKCSITNNSLSNNSSRINFKTSTKFIVKPPTKNKAHSSGIWKSKGKGIVFVKSTLQLIRSWFSVYLPARDSVEVFSTMKIYLHVQKHSTLIILILTLIYEFTLIKLFKFK